MRMECAVAPLAPSWRRARPVAPFWALVLAALVTSTPWPVASAAAEESASGPAAAERLVRETTARLMQAMRAQRDAIRADPARAYTLVEEIVSPHVDFERIARWVLGKHWRRASPEQQARFIDEFRTLIFRTYATAISENADAEVNYLGPRGDGGEVTVRTQVPQPGGPPIGINYRLFLSDGTWRFFDVAIEGVSLVTTYRSTFSAEVNRVGLDGLIERMAAKNGGRDGA